ncbi:hypothetical protein C942_00918 [Photobacterium marinum]|uniref:Uncharacterized protein n=1 Tax=Photobacterium marinum TaxID=1056511 RepID=L8JAM2_9GAMM|nr:MULTISPECIES: hypothetical protein [Photobacterium]ELR65831.1 hypothetical protein C942_00918 [Photobacterium marinum]
MEDKVLIADTKDILDAFVDNGLHKEFAIYCQFPHTGKALEDIQLRDAHSIEFNDGFRIQNN